jgi:acetyl-CoA synthetase
MLLINLKAVRGGKVVSLKRTVDEALLKCPTVHKVFVVKKTGNEDLHWIPNRDIWYTQALVLKRLN